MKVMLEDSINQGIENNQKETVWSEAVNKLVDLVEQLLPAKKDSPLVTAFDGPCASGKSTLADLLQTRLSLSHSCGLIRMDHFFLPPELRTGNRLAEPGGNIDYERFQAEVISQLPEAMDEALAYRVFSCQTMSFVKTQTIGPSKIVILEGSYSHHPRWRRYIDLAVFIKVSPDEQLERIRDRSGAAALEAFKNRWIPMENLYFDSFKIEEAADLVIADQQDKLIR